MDGIYSDDCIKDLVDRGAVVGVRDPAQVQPASLDLTLSARAVRLRASFLPGRGVPVEERARSASVAVLDLSDGAILEPGAVYLVEARERLDLPPDVHARANPKSSTGRVDAFVRVLADESETFDAVPAGYRGALWIEVIPLTFPVKVREGTRLAQVRFGTGRAVLDDASLARRHAVVPLVTGAEARFGDGLLLTVDLRPADGEMAGWRACRHAGVVDMDVVGALDPHDFWEPVRPRAGPSGRPCMVLDPGEFYILASRESVAVPDDLAAEMVAFDPGVGEFRAHYAGFFDCGFGTVRPSRAVLEVRSHQAPFLLEDGQVVGKLAFERMARVPGKRYGAPSASNYDGQRLRLSKHFREG